MEEPKDQEIEDRAMGLARKDKLAWVKLPHQKGHAPTPAGATNVERDQYREEARDQLMDEKRTRGSEALPE